MCFYRTQVQLLLCTSVTNWLNDYLLFSWLRFGLDFEVKVQLRFWSWRLVKILQLIFGQDFEAEASSQFCGLNWSRFWARTLVQIGMAKFGLDSKAEFSPTCDMTKIRYFGESTQPLAPFCLWQCFWRCFSKGTFYKMMSQFKIEVLPCGNDWVGQGTSLEGYGGKN